MRRNFVILALSCLWSVGGCTRYHLEQTWPDGAKTYFDSASCLSDKKINDAAFYRDSSGRVVVLLNGYSSSVNVQATEAVAGIVGKVFVAVLTGGVP